MVLVMGGDGSLSPSKAQDRFSRVYNDGIGQEPATAALRLFGEGAEPTDEGRVLVPSVRVPHPDILAGIEAAGLRYAGHRGLRASGITVTDWLTIYRANIEIESGYDPRATSHAGAIGLGQLMPDTADLLGVNPNNWQENLDGSARYLTMMLAEFGDTRLALAAYNAGPDAVRAHSGIPPFPETQNHIQRVMSVFHRLKGAPQ
ncbi:lytic transglycosylase domain-containing protein [Sedimentitalea sp.]|uniref:lytic transglycosylase domain-containing protein n=1 Tax=Sedimentitalea sp. TaxID=2048915 RepID=UPI003299D465